MRIEHVAMYVNELERAKDFFVKYFEANSGAQYRNLTTGFQSYFLSFEDGARLELMTRPDMLNEPKSLFRSGYAHIAFCVGSKDKVHCLTNELKEDGYLVISEPRTTGDGYYESCIVDLEGNQIEITV